MLSSFDFKVLQNLIDESLASVDETIELIITDANRQDFQKYESSLNRLHQLRYISLNRYSSWESEIWEVKVASSGYRYLEDIVE